jgi:hypothetical protein
MTRDEKQKLYGEKLQIARNRLSMLTSKAKRIMEKIEITKTQVARSEEKLKEGDDPQPAKA